MDRSPIDLLSLPEELVSLITTSLPVAAIARLAMTCKALCRWALAALARLDRLDSASLSVQALSSLGLCASLRWLSTRAIALAEVSLPGPNLFSDSCCSLLPPSVRRLDISGSGVSNQGLDTVARLCPLLCEAILRRCPLVGDAGVVALAERCAQLSSISLAGNALVTDRSLLALSALPLLERLGLHQCRVTASAIARLARCPRLTTLDVGRTPGLTDRALGMVVSSCPRLVWLNLCEASQLTDRALLLVSTHCRLLERLSCGGCPLLTRQGLKAVCAGCPRLQWLHAPHCDAVDEDCLAAAAELCPDLNSVDVRGCARLTKVALERFYNVRRQCHPQHDSRRISMLADDEKEAFAWMASGLRPRAILRMSAIPTVSRAARSR